jgi:hypothetical protein
VLVGFDEEVHRWIANGLRASLDDERKEHYRTRFGRTAS